MTDLDAEQTQPRIPAVYPPAYPITYPHPSQQTQPYLYAYNPPPLPHQQMILPSQPLPEMEQRYMQQEPPKPPKKIRRWIWMFLGLAIGLLFGFVAGLTVSATPSITSGIASNPPNVVQSPHATQPNAKVGQTLVIDNVHATLLTAKVVQPGQYDTAPKTGNQYIEVQVKIVNQSAGEVTYNAFDFHAVSGSGDITDTTFLTSVDQSNNLNYGSLAVGGSVTGNMFFQVPIGDHSARLAWKPSIFGDSTTYAWNLGL